MKRGLLFPTLILAVLVGLFFLSKYETFQGITSKYFLYYKNTNGGISKAPLPASSGTGDGNIYLTGADDKPVFSVEYGVSGEIKLLEDELDVVTDFADVVPPDDWMMNPSGHKMIQRLYNVFRYLENKTEGYSLAQRDTNKEIFDLYNFFRSPDDSPIRDCIINPYLDVTIDPGLNAYTLATCKEKVPTDLTFGIHDVDARYRRFRFHIFYKAYKEQDVGICDTLLSTKFPLDKEDDVIASHMNNYLLCQTLAEGDLYSKTPLLMSEAIRRTGFRINIALTEDKCDLYDDKRIQSLCHPFRDYYLKTIQGSGTTLGQ